MKYHDILPCIDKRTHDGRFKVELNIVEGSTLSENDIYNILRLSSWDWNPNEAPFELLGRSISMERSKAIQKQGVLLECLALSGIGFQKIAQQHESVVSRKDKRFYPPSTTNFMDGLNKSMMGTQFAYEKDIAAIRPLYRASGTYAPEELTEKLVKTSTVGALSLDKIAVPHVEAYGRYLDFRIEGGLCGFMIYPVPKFQRAHIDMYNVALAAKEDNNLVFHGRIGKLMEGIREVHDNGYVHLQMHYSNAFLTKPVPYVVDWATMRKLTSNQTENLRNRAIDIVLPLRTMIDVYSNLTKVKWSESHFTLFMGYIGYQLMKYTGEEDLTKLDRIVKSAQQRPNMLEIVVKLAEGLRESRIN